MGNELVSRLDIIIALGAKEIITPSSILSEYLPHVLTKAADKFSDVAIPDLIRSEMNTLTQQLGIRFHPEVIAEAVDAHPIRERERSLIPTKYPVNVPIKFMYEFNGSVLYEFNRRWLTYYNDRQDYGTGYRRYVYVNPAIRGRYSIGGENTNLGGSYAFLITQSFHGENLPLGRAVEYITGYRYIPDEFKNYVKKRVAVHLLHQIGEMVKSAGLASKTNTYDGVNQSESYEGWWRSTFHDTIAAWKEELDATYKELKSRYGNFAIGVA